MGAPVSVRIFGLLHQRQQQLGLPSTLDVEVPDAGTTGRGLAEMLDLPCDMIEGVFVNHTVYGIDHAVSPGDRVAFVPYGTPGPHRFFLGLYRAGKTGE